MAVKLKISLLLIGVLLIAGTLRLYRLGSVPPGLHIDEVSEVYNAYSLLKTGKDRYGMAVPIIFKSYGSYQPPIYTYLTMLPVLFLGPTAVAVKVVSVVSGIVTVFFTFLIIRDFYIIKKNNEVGLLAGLIVAVSPWAIFFSRVGTEASIGLAIFVAGFYFLLKSVNKIGYFPLAAFLLGLATHAYYSERILSILLLGAFTFINRKIYLKSKKWLFIGLLVFGLTLLPHLAILKSGAFTRRLDQVTYFNRNVSVLREFASQYSEYFSPRSLFFQSDDQTSRSMPDLSIFYRWMIVPGLPFWLEIIKTSLLKPFFF
jgi:predicted membrane-bound mannosyltransferase